MDPVDGFSIEQYILRNGEETARITASELRLETAGGTAVAAFYTGPADKRVLVALFPVSSGWSVATQNAAQ